MGTQPAAPQSPLAELIAYQSLSNEELTARIQQVRQAWGSRLLRAAQSARSAPWRRRQGRASAQEPTRICLIVGYACCGDLGMRSGTCPENAPASARSRVRGGVVQVGQSR